MTVAEPAAPDPRWLGVFPDQPALEAHVQGWPVSDAVPDDMARVLRTARQLLIQAYQVYEFAHVAVTWALLALEAGLNVCLEAQDKLSLAKMIQLARERQLIDQEEFAALEGARNVRNNIIHGGLLPSFHPAVAVEMLHGLHDAICDIYERTAQGDGPDSP